MTSEPLQLIRAQTAAIMEIARLAELRVLAVQAERLARLDQQILQLKYKEARKSAADQVPKRIRPRVVQALPTPPEPTKRSTALKRKAPKKLQSAVPAGEQTTRKQRKPKARIEGAV
jgi:hypothetical protein